MTHDKEKLHSFLEKAVSDLGAALGAVLICIGDELGFYRELAQGPLTPDELAQRTGTSERYVREWLASQAAGGYIEFEAMGARYRLNAEQAACLADPAGPMDIPGAYGIVQDLFQMRQRMLENFRSGSALRWEEHDPCLFPSVERFYRGGYHASLVREWLPACEGLVEKLKGGAVAADLGCGHGASTIIMARAFPRTEFIGVDCQPEAIRVARSRAQQEGVRNVRFIVDDAAAFEEGELDFVSFCDSLHAMPEPAAAVRHARAQLRNDGHALFIEPRAGDRIEDNLNPLGRMYYSVSSMVCVPATIGGAGPVLGAQAGEKALREVVVEEGGFTRFRRAVESPFSLVLEARP